jgi:hypothetical protein
MPYQRKTEDEFILQGYYSYGWEDLTTEETYKEAKARKREYQDNERGTYRIIKKRIPKTATA